MSIELLTQAIEGKWAILPRSLTAISEIIQDHSRVFGREVFHQNETSIQSAIGTMGNPIERTSFSNKFGSVGILTVDGPIIPRTVHTISSGPSASLEAFSRELKMMDEDPEIKNIVISFDSPGGFVTGTSEFSDLIKSLNTPTSGFVYGYAASAAYWIASSVGTLHASKTAEVGSIGTVALFEDRSKQLEKAGIRRFEIVSNLSPNKRLDVETDEGRKEMIKILDQITEAFIADVAIGRKTTSDNVLKTFGQGKMFIASEAKELGMIDNITTLSNLVQDLNSNNNQMEGLMSDTTDKPKAMTADEFKVSNPSAHNTIHEDGFKAGVASEQERIQGIEAITETYPEASAYIQKNKFSEGMTPGKMALDIIKAKDEIVKDAALALKTDGTKLTEKLTPVPTATEEATPEEATEDDASALIAIAVQAGSDKHMEIHGQKMENR